MRIVPPFGGASAVLTGRNLPTHPADPWPDRQCGVCKSDRASPLWKRGGLH